MTKRTLLFSLLLSTLLVACPAISFGQLAPLSIDLHEAIPEDFSELGFAVAAGDINGDGYDDAVLGVPEADAGVLINTGRILVRFGPAFADSTTILPPAPQASSDFGSALACGDIDGDGFADVIAGAPDESVGITSDVGRAYVFYGPSLTTSAPIDLPGLAASSDFGRAVALGDINGDGNLDIFVGAPEAPVSGQTAGIVASAFDGVTLALITTRSNPAPNSGDQFGIALATTDVNGDGTTDLIVGEPNGSVGALVEAGRVHVYQGPGLIASAILNEPVPQQSAELGRALAAGDINGDGFGDFAAGVADGQPLGVVDAGEVIVFFGPGFSTVQLREPTIEMGADFGSALAIGDVNGDGNDDLVVGAEDATGDSSAGAKSDAGEAFVFYGPTLTTNEQLVPVVVHDDDDFGFSATMGDFNNDGLADPLIGAKDGEVTGILDQGRAFAFLAQEDFGLSTVTLSASAGGLVSMTLAGGVGNGLRPYAMLGTPLGSSPGFQNGSVNVPINVHPTITPILLTAIPNAIGVLDAAGNKTLAIGAPPGVLPAGAAGLQFTFAWITTDVFNYASYPIVFQIVP